MRLTSKRLNSNKYNAVQNININNDIDIKKIKIILDKIDVIIAVYLFGSVAINKQNSLSDIDIAVLLKKNVNYFDYKLRIHHDIARLTKKEADVVVLNEVHNLYLIDSIINKGILLIDKNREKRIDYELSLSHAILDYKAFRHAIDAK
ncbi:MAG: nucleotidyltransferase domain-containing protein [Candidatus Acididesulfobacter diazotrophicus]|jgi:predicted nucleotidyltransferase|uniref:Nucleotidyltransferase domain-containing protein n=1 Tax=Candidatus Acididesulfobacter diazotrophicus TaxID=2597226 RepID=A0A519BN29_9DELT|nr:MAG: nucleotidyltransferase domain-containing protein [Candidatus Acididesulfobacter diazotrophicus]